MRTQFRSTNLVGAETFRPYATNNIFQFRGRTYADPDLSLDRRRDVEVLIWSAHDGRDVGHRAELHVVAVRLHAHEAAVLVDELANRAARGVPGDVALSQPEHPTARAVGLRDQFQRAVRGIDRDALVAVLCVVTIGHGHPLGAVLLFDLAPVRGVHVDAVDLRRVAHVAELLAVLIYGPLDACRAALARQARVRRDKARQDTIDRAIDVEKGR